MASRLGDLVTFGPADVRDAAAVDAALDLAVGRAPLRTLVHCAGRGGTVRLVNRDGTPGDYDLYREIVDINLVGTFNVLRLAATRMSANEPVDGERGVCVLTASVAAWEGQIGQIPYASAKAGVVGMTLVAARDLSRALIRVCSIAPASSTRRSSAGSRTRSSDGLAAQVPHPARLGQPAEFASTACTSSTTRCSTARRSGSTGRSGWRRGERSGQHPRRVGRPGRHHRAAPRSRNAINTATAEAIGAAMDRLDAETALVAGVHHRRRRDFCAGMDLKAFLAGERPSIPGRGFAGVVERPPEKPLIAAVEGYAVGRRVRDRARLRHGGRRRERAVRAARR